MIYRIYNFSINTVLAEFEVMSDILVWLNENYINMNNCYIQYFDGEWVNFEGWKE